MVNTSIIITSIAIVILFLLTIGICLYLYLSYSENSRNNSPNTSYCAQIIDTSNLEKVSQTCFINGQNLNYFYIASQGFVVTPFPTSYDNVCSKMCNTLTTTSCLDSLGNDITIQYDTCINNLQKNNPTSDCIPPTPIATNNNGDLYYAFSPSNSICS